MLLATACGDDDEVTAPSQTITQAATATPTRSTLAGAVQAAGLGPTLDGAGPFTVFAPVNTAFAAVPQVQVQRLLDPANRALLTKVLTYVPATNGVIHVIDAVLLP